jgi:hypothetical protein
MDNKGEHHVVPPKGGTTNKSISLPRCGSDPASVLRRKRMPTTIAFRLHEDQNSGVPAGSAVSPRIQR